MSYPYWGNVKGEYVVLGTDPTAKGRDILYPFDLPAINKEPLIMRTPYFRIIYENLGAIFGYDCSVENDAFTDYMKEHFMVINAISNRVKRCCADIETSEAFKAEYKVNGIPYWANCFHNCYKERLKEQITGKTVFLTSKYLVWIFDVKIARKLNALSFRTVLDGEKEMPKEFSPSSENNEYKARFVPLFRHYTYRLSDNAKRCELLRAWIHAPQK